MLICSNGQKEINHRYTSNFGDLSNLGGSWPNLNLYLNPTLVSSIREEQQNAPSIYIFSCHRPYEVMWYNSMDKNKTTYNTPPLNLSTHLNSHTETHLYNSCCGRAWPLLLALCSFSRIHCALCVALYKKPCVYVCVCV